MFSFTKRPEKTIQLVNREYRINLAFDVVISAFGVLDSEELDDEDKIEQCFDLLIIDDLGFDSLAVKSDIVSSIFQYINEQPYGHRDDEETEDEPASEFHSDFDYEQDAGAIYASFLNFYNIDLNQMIGRMHWDEFKALFDNLGAETPIQKIRQYRGDDLTRYKDDAERAQFISSQQFYYQLDKDKGTDMFSGNASSVFSMMFEEGKE
ncbi:Gp15 family bacteriophage protein [Leuconostoc gelidum]|uniref:Gp15 family bacteriophage protein n=1 Tax=Leuconostoc gelidum TaxID=1244 RepID=UPI001CC452B7|nr:Gp15 family bacteriophage protein [Leuconostoc gelidum]MBZ6000958.1 hypothetical protein [Leuconostoc gelidum subsp. gelidum]